MWELGEALAEDRIVGCAAAEGEAGRSIGR
jgi:hypothetical protein